MTGANSTIIVSSENGVFESPYDYEAGFARVGRGAGADGTLNILDGARMEIREGATNNTDTTLPGMRLGHDGATGTVLIDGAGSVLSITQNSPGGAFGGPFLVIGRGDNAGLLGGDGAVTISNGGLVELIGEGSFVILGARAVAAGGAASGGTLDILSGGRLVVDGTTGEFFMSIGSGAGTTGDVTVDGVGSRLDFAGADTSSFIVGIAGAGTLDVLAGGVVGFDAGTLVIGAQGTGAMTIDGVGSLLDFTGAANLTVGIVGAGTLDVLAVIEVWPIFSIST